MPPTSSRSLPVLDTTTTTKKVSTPLLASHVVRRGPPTECRPQDGTALNSQHRQSSLVSEFLYTASTLPSSLLCGKADKTACRAAVAPIAAAAWRVRLLQRDVSGGKLGDRQAREVTRFGSWGRIQDKPGDDQ